MNASTAWADEGQSAADRENPQNGSSWPSNDERGGQSAHWCLEEFDEPEAWALASFDDLLPQEMI